MHCPRCGAALQKIDRVAELREASDRYQDSMDAWMGTDMSSEPPEEEKDESIHYECVKGDGCTLGGTEFIHHHPFKGLKSSPGDSWSLSWIK